jgi:hypothetical protein
MRLLRRSRGHACGKDDVEGVVEQMMGLETSAAAFSDLGKVEDDIRIWRPPTGHAASSSIAILAQPPASAPA